MNEYVFMILNGNGVYHEVTIVAASELQARRAAIHECIERGMHAKEIELMSQKEYHG